jgi:hypothetical protein
MCEPCKGCEELQKKLEKCMHKLAEGVLFGIQLQTALNQERRLGWDNFGDTRVSLELAANLQSKDVVNQEPEQNQKGE